MKKRVLSAAVLLTIFIPLLAIGGIPFKIGVGIVSILAFKEVIDLKKKDRELPSIIKIIGVICLLLIIFMTPKNYINDMSISYISLGLLLICFLLPTIFYGKNDKYNTKDAFYLIGWTLLLGIFFNSLIFLVDFNILYLIYLLLITILNDTFALIFGRLIGNHKLIPNVSPKKTWEGSICGAILGTFIAVMYFINIINPAVNLMRIIVITLMLSIIGQIGDLVFSKIKREVQIKDFSNLILSKI